MSEIYTERQYLDARKRFLNKMRNNLNWSTEDAAKKLKVMEIEYVNFENGLSKDLTDYEWDDIQYFLTSHLKELDGE